ncbi:MAG: porin [Duganella sp.]
MKRHNAALAAALMLAGWQTAHAQSNVQLYGVIDVAVEHVTNASATGGSITRMPSISGGMMPSRIGFRGTEDLGGGLKAIFALENGFSADTGSQGQGRLFGRQAWVGLAGSWGQVTLGRTYSMLFSSFFESDVIGPSQFSIGSLDTYLPSARHDNSIAYSGKFGAYTVGATYSLGRDNSAAGGPSATNCPGEVANDSRACRNWSASLKYDSGSWGLVGAYDRYNGGTGAAAAFGPASSAQSDTRGHVGGYVKLGELKLAGGFVRRDNEGSAATPRSNLSYLGATYLWSPVLVIDAQVARQSVRNSNRSADLIVLRANYLLSKRSSVYAMIGNINNDGASAVALSAGGTAGGAGMSQNGVLAGIKHAF